jgi:hypothetical protein
MAWKGRVWAGSRHSDNEKFCNDLNDLKTPKMSERPLKKLQDFPTAPRTTLRISAHGEQVCRQSRSAPAEQQRIKCETP